MGQRLQINGNSVKITEPGAANVQDSASRNHRVASIGTMLNRLVVFLLFALASISGQAVTTTGGVNWQETLGYEKPQFYPITYTESSTNVYYVDLEGGSGTTCSSGSPCAWSGLSGKAGINDGTGALIYCEGTSGATWSDFAITGSAGNEVVVKPLDDATNCIWNGDGTWNAAKKYLIFDGGPNMRIRFNSSSNGAFDSPLYIGNSLTENDVVNVTFYRTFWYVTSIGLWFHGYGGYTNLSFINSEFTAENATNSEQHSIYLSHNGTGTGSQGYGLYFYNNIIRDTTGEAVELRMSAANSSIDGIVISGNAMHNIGKGTCDASWRCRSTFTMTEGDITNVLVKNNIMWDLGENCMRIWSVDSTFEFYNNTCYQWGATGSDATSYCVYGFAGYSPVTSFSGNFKNNILYATGSCNGTNKTAFPSSGGTSKDYNACESGDTCGTNSQTVSGTDFLSLDENSAGFLKISATDSPYQNGTDLTADVPNDYLGQTRSAPVSIGAMEVDNTGDPGGDNGLAIFLLSALFAVPFLGLIISRSTWSVPQLSTRFRSLFRCWFFTSKSA